MKFLLDAWAWIEYLKGGEKGEKINKILTGDNEIYALSITIAELISKAKRMGENPKAAYNSIVNNSVVIDIDSVLAKEAGLLHAETRKKIKDFGLTDAFIITAARNLNAKIITGDKHFESFKETIKLN